MKPFKITSFFAFDNSPGWKLDDDGNVVLKDGNPVYVDSSGREAVIKHDTISNLNAEAKSHREAKEAAEAALKPFEGLDPEVARKAIDQVKKLDAKELIDSGKVDELKQQITSQFQEQLTEKDNALKNLQSELDSTKIDQVFTNSDFVRNNIAVPPDMFQATFRNHFKIKEGKVAVYDKAGNILMSKENIGEPADVNEGLKLLVESHPQRDVILKADVGSGSGSSGGGGSNGSGRVIKRDEFSKLPPHKQAEIAGKVKSGEMRLTD